MEPTRVILDARKLGDGGIGAYVENLVDGLTEMTYSDGEQCELTLIVTPEHLQPRDNERHERIRRKLERWSSVVKIVSDNARKYSLDEMFYMPRRLKKLIGAHDCFHSPHYTLPFGVGIPTVTTVHDVIHVNRPENLSHRLFGRRLIKSAVRRSSHVITVSNSSLLRLSKLQRLNPANISVIPNGLRRGVSKLSPAILDTLRRDEKIDEPFYLFVGTDRPHKGFVNLLRAWFELKHRRMATGEKVAKLYVVGARFGSETRTLVYRNGLTDSVVFLGDVSDERLAALMNLSQGVVVPSLEEGFGMVALEGLACGVPVICTPEAALQEVCGEAAWYSDDFGGTALAAAIEAVENNPELRAVKISRGLISAAEFSIHEIARRTFDIYRFVSGKSQHPELTRRLHFEMDQAHSLPTDFDSLEPPVREGYQLPLSEDIIPALRTAS